MNRRSFIKTICAVVALPGLAVAKARKWRDYSDGPKADPTSMSDVPIYLSVTCGCGANELLPYKDQAAWRCSRGSEWRLTIDGDLSHIDCKPSGKCDGIAEAFITG